MKIIYPPFLRHIRQSGLIHPDSTVVAGLSGGKDSVAMVLLLRELQKDIPFRLVAAYFNHRIRKDQAAEQKWVEDFCRQNGLDLTVGAEDIPGFQRENRLNLEHAASLRRYAYLKTVAKKNKNSVIATGHTRSDLVETFFMKLLRGSGSRGLGSIFPLKSHLVIRPLLIFSSRELQDFLRRNKQAFYQDASNRDNRFLRNRIRNRLIPEIRKIDPMVEQHVARAVEMLQDEYFFFTAQSKDFLEKNLLMGCVLRLKDLDAVHPALRRFIIRGYIEKLKGDLLDIDFEHVERLIDPRNGRADSHIPGLPLKRRKGYLYPEKFSLPPYSITLNASDTVQIEAIGRRITVTTVPAFRKPKTGFQIILDSRLVRFPLVLRNPQKTDRYVKLNAAFPQTVFEMIRVSGLPSDLRNYCPLVINGDGRLIWVVGSPVADAFKVTETTGTRFVRLACT